MLYLALDFKTHTKFTKLTLEKMTCHISPHHGHDLQTTSLLQSLRSCCLVQSDAARMEDGSAVQT